jgi:hypothetical protein
MARFAPDIPQSEDWDLSRLVIPEIKDEKLKAAVTSLCHAAVLFRGCFTATTEGRDPREVIRECGPETVSLALQVLQKWQDHLGIPDDDVAILPS